MAESFGPRQRKASDRRSELGIRRLKYVEADLFGRYIVR